MSKKEYTYIVKKLCKLILLRVDGTDLSNGRASQLPQTSPPKIATSPSKKGTSPPLRLGKTGGSPGVAAPPTLAFCRGLDGVLNQNTGFREKKVFPGRKNFFSPPSTSRVAVNE